MTVKLNELISLQTGASAIVLSEGLNQKDLISSFVPTHSAVNILKHIQSAVQYGADIQERAINCFGVYGSGKSRLAVLIGHLLRDGVHGKEFVNFLDRLESGSEVNLVKKLKSTFLPSDDEDARPYLIIPIYGTPSTTIQGALVENLYKVVKNTPGLDASAILLKTEFEVAIKRLEEILEEDPILKETFLPALNLGNHYIDATNLLQGLVNRESNALSTFSEWHKKITYGAPFEAINYGASLAKDIFLNAAKQLFNHNYKGIAVIWDEFGYALENMLEDSHRSPTKEIFELQEFVEAACYPTSGGHLVFVGLTHVSLAEYGPRSNASENIKSRLETIQGRFTPLRVELRPAESEGYHLLAAQLLTSDLGRQLKQDSKTNAINIFERCKEISIFGHIGQDLSGIIDSCYPLHPLTAAALLALSSRYAAATRTAFHFLTEMENIGQFDQSVDPKNLFTNELIRLPMLISFYEEEMQSNGYADQLNNYKNASSQVNSEGADKNTITEREKVLSVLMLSSLLDSNFQSNDSFLSLALHDNDFTSSESQPLRDALLWLSKAALIWKNDITGLWSIGGGGGTDFEALVSGAIEKIPNNSLAEYIRNFRELAADLFPMLGDHFYDPSPSGIVRSYSVEILSVIPTSKPKLANYKTAKIYLVLGNTPDESIEIERLILGFPQENFYYWFCFEELSELQKQFRLLVAITKLLEQTHSEDTKKRLETNFDSVRSDLLKKIGGLYGREGLSRGITKVIKQGNSTPIEVTSWYDFSTYIQNSVDGLYKNELQIRASQKKRNVLGEIQQVDSAETIEIVDRILKFDSNTAFQTDMLGYPETSEPGAVVDAILGSNSFFIQRPNGWDIKNVDELSGNAKTVVEIIRKEMFRIRQVPYRLIELANTFSQEPYGIPVSALPLFIAVAIRQDISRIVWVQGSTNVSKNLCLALISENIGVRVADFSQNHLNIAEVLIASLKAIMGELDELQTGDKHVKARNSLIILKQYLDDIPLAILNSPKLNKDLRILSDFFHSIGKTLHEQLEKIAELIDSNKLLQGSEIPFDIKTKARDTLVSMLSSYHEIADQKKFDALKQIEDILPNLADNINRSKYIDSFKGTNELGNVVSNILESSTSSAAKYELILSKLIPTSIKDASELELGIAVGQLKMLSKELLNSVSADNLDQELLDSLLITINKSAKEASIPLSEMSSYLKAIIKIYKNDNKELEDE